jgi:subtilisin family serine protease
MPMLRFGALAALCLALAACQSGYRRKLSPELQQALAVGPADRKLRVLVDLSAQLDLAKLSDSLAHRELGRAQRRWLVTTALSDVARERQSALRPVLEQLRRDGAIESYRGFVIVNRLLVVGTAGAIKALARRADVATIDLESAPQVSVLAVRTAEAGEAPNAPSWAVRAVRADRAWRRGLAGRGVVVGIIDAGASAAHEQLRGNYRGGDDSWHDPTGQNAAPVDGAEGHGTSVLSAAVAQNVAGKKIGAAPGARWVACVGLPHGRYDNVALTECADWMLTTAQPDVLINAWLLPTPGCDRSLARIVDAWRAAQILPVFAAGNTGPVAPSDGSPANYAVSVGAIAQSDTLVSSSSRGPNRCDGAIFPTLVAPGEDVPAASPLTPSAYSRSRGTSIAAGFVAGAAAILLERHPDATVEDVEHALRAGARDLGPPGPDNQFGYGALDVLTALDSLGRFLARKAAPDSTSAPTPHQ